MSNRLRVTMANGQTYHLETGGYEAKVAIFGFNAGQPPFSGDFLATEEGVTVSRAQIASIGVVMQTAIRSRSKRPISCANSDGASGSSLDHGVARGKTVLGARESKCAAHFLVSRARDRRTARLLVSSPAKVGDGGLP